jgi:acyl carrier protein
VKLLGRALEWRPVQLGIAKMDCHAWAATYPSWAASPRYTALLERAVGDAGGQSAAAMRETLLQLDETMRSQTVLALLVQVMATVMEATPEDVDVEESLLSLGIDSLMALDLQVAIERDFGVRVSTLELMKGTTLAQLAERLVGTLLDAQPVDAPNEEHTPAPSPAKRSLDQLLANNDVEMLLASIDDLSSDEIDRVLARLA